MAGAGTQATGRPVVLFGAFDRHNFGDLLFPHLAAARLPGYELHFAGLAARDLRAFGGHRVEPLPSVAAALGGRPATVIHVGGEILTCTAWEAAAMLLPPGQAQQTIAYLEARPVQRRAWVRRTLGLRSLAPYLAPRGLFAPGSRFAYCAVGGVAMDACPAAMRAEVLARLADADHVAVRDARTRAHLGMAGIASALLPDPAVGVAALCGGRVAEAAGAATASAVRQALPQGYLAVQFAAEFGDDRTLGQLAGQLSRVSSASGLGLALFRAGAAPWHDDLDALRRLETRLRGVPVMVFESLHLWDICALIAGSRGYCGSSLHGRVVAGAFARPRLGLRPPGAGQGACKQQAFAATWEPSGTPGVAPVEDFADALLAALAVEPRSLSATAIRLADAFTEGFAPFAALADAA